MVDQMTRGARTTAEQKDMRDYIRLAQAEKAKPGGLAKSEKKRLNRVRTRLLQAGLIRKISREQLETTAREHYHALPAWRRWQMRLMYHTTRFWAATKVRWELWRLR